MKRSSMGMMALALAVSAAGWSVPTPSLYDSSSSDPHKPRPRSKGEKARNKKFRAGGRS